MPMQARGSMKVGKMAGVCVLSSRSGEPHMKPAVSSFVRERSLSRTEARDASTNWRRALFSTRTSEWNADRSNSTSAFHMSAFSLIGTSDITLVRSSSDFVSVSTGATGYFTSSGKGRSAWAASKGSPERMPNFIISSARRQGSCRARGVSHSTLPSTVMPPSSLEMRSRYSSTIICTRAASELTSCVQFGNPSSIILWMSWPSVCHSFLCQVRQNLKSTVVAPWRLSSVSTAVLVMFHRRPFMGLFGVMIRAPSGRLRSALSVPCRIVCGS
mmetsp:Transcript_101985/g.288780  ORF Transcript_101985/g.288780 Transcript_101985/m.288780 type:complete len:272 (-) Transcript_101985:142-957(-)